MTVSGVAPVTGAMTSISILGIGMADTEPNVYDKVTVAPVLLSTVALFVLIVEVESPAKVYPLAAVNVTVALYAWPAWKVPCTGSHVTVTVPPPVTAPDGVVITLPLALGVAPVDGAVTVIAAAVIEVAVFAN